MTKGKAEKTAVRARMAKTGERYTTARHYLLDHHLGNASAAEPMILPPSAPDPDPDPEPEIAAHPGERARAATPAPGDVDLGLSEAALLRATGKTWAEWFGLIDAWDGTARSHAAIARHLHEAHGIDDWWAQGVTVGYERARGMRVRHQTPDGFTVSVSKTVPVPAATLWTAFVDTGIRERWLEPGTLRLRTSQQGRSARFDVLLPGAEGTRLEIWFTAKGEAKSSAALQHVKLAGPEELEPWRAFWKERLRRLAAMLAAG